MPVTAFSRARLCTRSASAILQSARARTQSPPIEGGRGRAKKGKRRRKRKKKRYHRGRRKRADIEAEIPMTRMMRDYEDDMRMI